jgi:hypothetical protein
MIAAGIPIQRPADAKLLVVDSQGQITNARRSRFRIYYAPATSLSPMTQRRYPLVFLESTPPPAVLSKCGWPAANQCAPMK